MTITRRPRGVAVSAIPRFGLATGLFAATATWSCEPAPRFDLAIENARIFTATGSVLEDADVGIEEDRISVIATDGSPVPARETIDASGMTLLPGLIDAHVHLLIKWPLELGSDEALAAHVEEGVIPRLREYLNHGVTTVFSTGDFWPAIRDLRDDVAAGHIPGPRILTAGPVFAAPDGHPSGTVCPPEDAWCRSRLSVEVATVGQAREAVLRVASEGPDAIKAILGGLLGPPMEPEVFSAVVDAAHEAGLRAYVHPDASSDTWHAVHAGVDGLVHLPALREVPDSVIALLVERGLTVTTTLGASAPVVDDQGIKRHPMAGFWSDEFEARATAHKASVRALADAGVPLVLGTDMPVSGPWEAIAREIALLSDAGLTNEQILVAATRNAAVHLGLGTEIGTVEAGKIADLVLVRGDPLEELSALSEVELVIQGGVVRR
ncbi:MAG: amidohydrolase family protein [Gemmatimonadota bacterium]|nr:amidohydrolase family protein [Gemmatimonadota bacterium]